MGWFTRTIDRADSILSWWDRLSRTPWVVGGVTVMTLVLFQLAAVFTELPLMMQITTVLGTAASVTCLFTFLPRLLVKITPPSFAISVPHIVTEGGNRLDNVRIEIRIINRSPKKRVVLELGVCFRSASGEKDWAQPINPNSINVGLGPQEHTERTIGFFIRSDRDFIPTEPNALCSIKNIGGYVPASQTEKGIYLNVIDYISGQRAHFRIPGDYPPNFFTS